jgi:hypothetical protein
MASKARPAPASNRVSFQYSVTLSVEFEPADPAAMIQANDSIAVR